MMKMPTIKQRATVRAIMTLFVMALLFVALVAGVIGYQVGHRQGIYTTTVVAMSQDGKTLTTDDIKAIRLESEIIKTELSTLTQERDISLNNLNLLREELQALKRSHAELEKINSTLMSAAVKEGGMPLQVLNAKMTSMPNRAYEYRFEVAMVSADGKGKILTPKLTLLNATSMVDIPLKPASYELQGVVNIQGRFIMPEGFDPKQIKLKLTVDGRHLEKLYNWRVSTDK